MKLETPIIAYFYPQDNTDKLRLAAAKKAGKSSIPSEMELLKQATPLFKNHTHPTYTIGDGITEWQDTDKNAIARQAEIAREYGLDAWMLLTYTGVLNGKKHTELQGAVKIIANRKDSLQFAFASCLGLPRTILPVPHGKEQSRSKERNFDLTPETFFTIIDEAAKYWGNPRYLRLNGKPLITIYGLRPASVQKLAKIRPNLVEELELFAEKKYGEKIHLTANAFDSPGAIVLSKFGFKHITTYSHLPTFDQLQHDPDSKNATNDNQDVQNYLDQLRKRKKEWYTLLRDKRVNAFTPNVTVGWDGSSRGEPGLKPDQVSGKFPWFPIIDDATPENFKIGLREVWEYLKHIPTENRILLILAWNEIGNGSVLLPRVNADGNIDFSHLKTLKQFVNS